VDNPLWGAPRIHGELLKQRTGPWRRYSAHGCAGRCSNP
jgi:hypothetical protein